MLFWLPKKRNGINRSKKKLKIHFRASDKDLAKRNTAVEGDSIDVVNLRYFRMENQKHYAFGERCVRAHHKTPLRASVKRMRVRRSHLYR